MLSRLLSTTDALNLLEKNEDHFFDKKSVKTNGAGLQKVLVSFANSDGGEVIVGIEDEKSQPNVNKRWEGHSSIEEYNGLLQAITEITPQIPCSMNFLSSKGFPGYLLLIQIDKSSQVHQTSSRDVYVRKGAQSLPVKDPEHLITLKFSKGLASFEDVEVPNVPPEIIVESTAMAQFLSDLSPKTEPLEFCVNQHLLDIRTWNPKVCGLVLFSPNPSSFIPTRAGVRITRYETKEEDPERDHLSYSELIELPYMI
ncbi:ATP-binding protein [Undibacterium sp.]|jgi:ATP-dependent DNA helicase RecG|uniref:ATP-binding protein n=1 Tax=Undibacterium sp. TaxID=1914977 RepID=UPI002CB29A39|nr:ATP-binding protein [Undibacterium sp.]HTD03034.1 ATP-binding protein [Undibacterium sp.]